jgi:hypothetical protein
MRCASAAYVGSISGDANMTYWGEVSSKRRNDGTSSVFC